MIGDCDFAFFTAHDAACWGGGTACRQWPPEAPLAAGFDGQDNVELDKLMLEPSEATEGCGETEIGGFGGGVRRGKIGIEHSDDEPVLVGDSRPPNQVSASETQCPQTISKRYNLLIV